MAAKAIAQSPGTQIRSVRVVGIPRLGIGGHMSAGDDDRIAFDRLVMDDSRMTGCTAFALCSGPERLHVLAMTHYKTDILHRLRKVSRGHFGDSEDSAVTTDAHI